MGTVARGLGYLHIRSSLYHLLAASRKLHQSHLTAVLYTRLRYPSEAHPKLVVMITDEVLRLHTIGSGFPKRYVRSRRRWDIV
jgi:hypothetical protein